MTNSGENLVNLLNNHYTLQLATLLIFHWAKCTRKRARQNGRKCFPGDERDGRVELVARVLDPEVRVDRVAGAHVARHHQAALAGQRIEVPQRLQVIPAGTDRK